MQSTEDVDRELEKETSDFERQGKRMKERGILLGISGMSQNRRTENASLTHNCHLPSFDRPSTTPLHFFLQEGLTSLFLLWFFAECSLCAVQKVTQNIHCFSLVLFDHKQTINILSEFPNNSSNRENMPRIQIGI